MSQSLLIEKEIRESSSFALCFVWLCIFMAWHCDLPDENWQRAVSSKWWRFDLSWLDSVERDLVMLNGRLAGSKNISRSMKDISSSLCNFFFWDLISFSCVLCDSIPYCLPLIAYPLLPLISSVLFCLPLDPFRSSTWFASSLWNLPYFCPSFLFVSILI